MPTRRLPPVPRVSPPRALVEHAALSSPKAEPGPWRRHALVGTGRCRLSTVHRTGAASYAAPRRTGTYAAERHRRPIPNAGNSSASSSARHGTAAGAWGAARQSWPATFVTASSLVDCPKPPRRNAIRTWPARRVQALVRRGVCHEPRTKVGHELRAGRHRSQGFKGRDYAGRPSGEFEKIEDASVGMRDWHDRDLLEGSQARQGYLVTALE